MRRELPLMLVFLAGLTMSVQFFVPSEFSGNVKDFMTDWLIIIGIFAMALGIYSLVRVSWVRIKRRAGNWQYSIITLVGLFAMMFFGLQIPGVKYGPPVDAKSATDGISAMVDTIGMNARSLSPESIDTTIDRSAVGPTVARLTDSCLTITSYIVAEEWILKTPEQEEALRKLQGSLEELKSADSALQQATTDSAKTAAAAIVSDRSDSSRTVLGTVGPLDHKEPFVGGLASYMFRHFFDYIMIPIQSTMFSILAFFIASAAYRAFRARSILASVLLLAALVLMLRLIPLGPITGFFSDLSSWILLTPNLAAKRAILIGVGLGMVATALKVVLGIERNYLGRD
jgi:hypothetical protein